jgi:hypothetical protein
MGNSNSEEVTFDQIDALARQLFRASDPSGVWAAQDEATRLHFRRLARERIVQELADETQRAGSGLLTPHAFAARLRLALNG